MLTPPDRTDALMRLLTVTHFYETHGGGIERVAGHLNRHLARLGHETWWAASDGDAPPAPETAKPVPLRCLNAIERLAGLPMPIPTLAALRQLGRAVRASDAIIVHDALYMTSIAAMRAARKANKPVLMVQHIAEIPFRNRLLRAAMRAANGLVTRRMLGAADQVVFISETTAAALSAARFRRPPLIIFNGVDTELFRPATAAEAAGVRRDVGLPADRRVALFVGRFVEKKGLAVIAEIARRRPDLEFVLAGSGPIDPERWGLPNLRVARGFSGERLAALYRASDALLLPSVGEGFPLVIQEALATNLPILCGAESAAADPAASALLHGLPVDLSAPAATADTFAAVLDVVLAGPADTRRVELARSRYAWPASAARYDAALRGMVAERIASSRIGGAQPS